MSTLAVINLYDMNPIDFGYSMKNIPPPSKETHIYKIIEKKREITKTNEMKRILFTIKIILTNVNQQNVYIIQENSPWK